ncbi:MAG: hypothetical protein R8M11_01170, partial [Gallionella sp.]
MQFDDRSIEGKPCRVAEKLQEILKTFRVARLVTSTTLLCLCTIQSVHAGSDQPVQVDSGYSERINEIGLTMGRYSYKEPGLMSLQGLKAGINLRITMVNPEWHRFITSEVRFAGGTVDYQSNGTGSSSGNPDWYFEGRVLLGN